jgi:hypothetical protein
MPPIRSPKWHDPISEDSCEFGFPITKIITIEDHKLNNTFLHVAFGSQSLLKLTSDQTGSDTN